MKTKLTISLLLILFGMALPMSAQIKMGHANLELILAYMPETQSMNKTLQDAEQILSKNVQVKQNYLQTKVAEYQENEAAYSEADKQAKQQELQKLDQEVRQDAQKAQNQLMAKQQELLQPITEKLEAAIKALAADEGYNYILNSMTGGNSIVLYGPPEHELTEKLMTRLGIEIPKDETAEN